jgi:hypothetical protein
LVHPPADPVGEPPQCEEIGLGQKPQGLGPGYCLSPFGLFSQSAHHQ